MGTRAMRLVEGRRPLRAHKVLIADDQQEVLTSLRRLLREEPYDLITCDSASKALEWLAENPVDMVIADERMPEMRGSDLLERVRDAWPQTIRVILTGQRLVIINNRMEQLASPGFGFGLEIVTRACTHAGWRLETRRTLHTFRAHVMFT